MFRSVTFSSADFHCRYLDISLTHGQCWNSCDGRFGDYLKDRFALEKLPYDLKLSKLIIAGALSPDLFVRLPSSFFEKWANFPECPAIWQGNMSKLEVAAGNFIIDYHPQDHLTVGELLHPYDRTPLKREYVQQFKSKIPRRMQVIRMAEDRNCLPFEAYFAYWRGYVLVDALTGHSDIDRFLSAKPGSSKMIKRVSSVNEDWNRKYSGIFNRLSLYRTAMTIVRSQNTGSNLTQKCISEYLLDLSEATAGTLEADIEHLLELFERWQCEIDRNGRIHLAKALDLLRQDIYFLLEWLCSVTDKGEEYFFSKWSYKSFRTANWAQLRDVLAFEEFKLQRMFLRYQKLYCEEIRAFGYAGSPDKTYEGLCAIESFAPWIRSFCEIHKGINRKFIIEFKQPRILDYLIVITTRTEIVIRDMYTKCLRKDSPALLKEVLKGLALAIQDERYVRVLKTLPNDWEKTVLHDKPEDIFAGIDSITPKKGWSKEMMCFYKQILKFATSRNYFAHHSYEDKILNSRREAIAADVLKSCIQSLVLFESLLQA